MTATPKLHSTNGGNTFLQTVDYSYNIRGWLKSVNNPYNLGTSDLFAFKLSYDDAPQGIYIPYQPKYNGNISTMVWINNDDAGSQNLYNYTYDNLNRLKEAIYGRLNGGYYSSTGKYNEYGITYDRNGNLQTLKRKDFNGNLIDDLSYDYNPQVPGGVSKGNRLFRVSDAIATTSTINYDFEEQIESVNPDYTYDQNGNMKKDLNKGINITYNYLNLPVTITWNANNPNDKRKIEWLYDAAGSKLRKTVYNTDGEATMVTDYVNGFVYNTNYGDALPQLSFFPMSEGRVVNLGGSYELQYWLKDHLGNTRIAFHSGAGGTAEVLQKDFYYPFGLSFTFGNLIGDENKFKYNGKELEDEHGLYWYHYGVRYYDPQLGRWHTIDPANEYNSPYLFVGNNPIIFKDPDGNYTEKFIGDNYYFHRYSFVEALFHSIGEAFIPFVDLIGELFPQDPSLNIPKGASFAYDNSATQLVVDKTLKVITGSKDFGDQIWRGVSSFQALQSFKEKIPNIQADMNSFNYALSIQRKGISAFEVGNIIEITENGIPIWEPNKEGKTIRINPDFVKNVFNGNIHKAYKYLTEVIKFDNSLRKFFNPDCGFPEYSKAIEALSEKYK